MRLRFNGALFIFVNASILPLDFVGTEKHMFFTIYPQNSEISDGM